MLDKVDGKPTTVHSSPHVRCRQCRHGQMLYMPHDIFIGRSLDLYWEYSEIETKLFAQLLKPGHVVFEIGANIGCHTVPMARLIGDGGRVFAFEPQRIIHQMLCANIAQNGLFNVWAERKAVGNPDPGQWELIGVPSVNYAQPGNFGGVALEPSTPEKVFGGIVSINMLCLPAEYKIKVDGVRKIESPMSSWKEPHVSRLAN